MNDLGKIKKYQVSKTTPLGYMLSDGENEYFLHRNESNFRELAPRDEVEAFIYSDKKGRLAATLYLPTMTVDSVGFGTVAAVNKDFGLFLNIGISKDVLLSADDLPEDFSDWPRPGDKIACRLKARGGRLLAKPATKTDFLSLQKITLEEGTEVTAHVYRKTPSGVNLVTEDFNVIFVYKEHLKKEYRLGEKAEVLISGKGRDDYYGIIPLDKEKQAASDREKILEYLKKMDGAMAITEKSDAIVIKKVFDMSKRAFKAALASLEKEGIIEIQEDKVILLV